MSELKSWSTGKLCKRLKFVQTEKWYMLKLEYVREKETHAIIEDFDWFDLVSLFNGIVTFVSYLMPPLYS